MRQDFNRSLIFLLFGMTGCFSDPPPGIFPTAANGFGALTVHGNLSAHATVSSSNGKVVLEKDSPFENEKILVGVYTIKTVNSVLDMENTQTVTIEENKLAVIEAGLKPHQKSMTLTKNVTSDQETSDLTAPSKEFGLLSIHGNLSAAVTITSSSDQVVLKKNSPFEKQRVPVGSYTVTLVNSVLDLENVEKIVIQEGKLLTVEAGLHPKARNH